MPYIFWISLFFVVAVTAVCLTPFIILASKLSSNFDKLKIGMSYQEVIDIMNKPRKEHRINDDLMHCIWRRMIFRNVAIIRNVYFEKGVVISLSKDKDWHY